MGEKPWDSAYISSNTPSSEKSKISEAKFLSNKINEEMSIKNYASAGWHLPPLALITFSKYWAAGKTGRQNVKEYANHVNSALSEKLK